METSLQSIDPGHLTLAPLVAGELHLWLVQPASLSDGQLADCERLLSDAERRSRDRFRMELDRRNATVARALVRSTLSRYVDRAPEAWRFRDNEHGRPYVDSEVGVYFNLTHCDGLVALAVASFEAVGVDAEMIERNADLLSLAASQFAPPEAEAVIDASGAARRDHFFDVWTLKEAYIKARGKGLTIPLDQFAFEIDGARGTLDFARADALDDPYPRWLFRVWSFGSRWRLAIGAAPARPPLLVRARVGAPGASWTAAPLALRATSAGLSEVT